MKQSDWPSISGISYPTRCDMQPTRCETLPARYEKVNKNNKTRTVHGLNM